MIPEKIVSIKLLLTSYYRLVDKDASPCYQLTVSVAHYIEVNHNPLRHGSRQAWAVLVNHGMVP